VLSVSCVLQYINSRQNFRLPQGPPLGRTKGAHVQTYWFLKLKFVFCQWHLSIIRPYLYSLLPENTMKLGSFVVEILHVCYLPRIFLLLRRLLIWVRHNVESRFRFTRNIRDFKQNATSSWRSQSLRSVHIEALELWPVFRYYWPSSLYILI
jgi:hypothetical protein